MDKRHHLVIDIIIGILIVVVIVLVDHLIVNWRSRPADEVWTKVEVKEGEAGKGGEDGLYQLKDGERAFIPILNFHHLGTAPARASKVDQSFYVEPQKFEQIINDLLDNDYRPVFAGEVVDYLAKKELPEEKIMAITFDDGNEDFYTNAWPILQKYKIKSSMYIMTGVKGKSWLTPEQILELDKSGLVEFGSHTVWHPFLTKISPERQIQEMSDSKKFLEDLLKKSVTILCYPFGFYNEQIKKEAQDIGYSAGLTFDQDAWQNPEDLFALTRISVYPGLNVMKFFEKLKAEK